MSIDYSVLSLPKGRSRKSLKAKKDRAEDKVKKAVRAKVEARDGYCRVQFIYDESMGLELIGFLECFGVSTWAHRRGHRRSHTRGMAPEKRHTTGGTLMLCEKHHRQEERGELKITCLTRKGCDGPLKFRRKA